MPARTKLIVTVHDLSFEHFPDCFTLKQRLWHRAIRPRELLERADAIIVVSETTKRDLVETYGIPEGKINVIYPGIDAPSPTPSPSQREGEKKREWGNAQFLLSLSELSPRKNLDGLIAAFEQLTAYGPDAPVGIPTRKRWDFRLPAPPHLVVAGNHGSAERSLRRQIARSPARDRIHLLGPVTEDEKRALLARASCFVYLSLWEGFGFPPLEAMAAGVPVVASTGGALPEVLGDALPRRMTGAALLVDPLDPAAIADAIARVLTNDTLRTDLITRGRSRAARYRWEDAARGVWGILQSLS